MAVAKRCSDSAGSHIIQGRMCGYLFSRKVEKNISFGRFTVHPLLTKAQELCDTWEQQQGYSHTVVSY